jgi:small subunit ribosomal protein S13
MLRLAGVDLPNEKKVCISLRYLYGVGPKVAMTLLKETRIDPDKRAGTLTGEEVSRLQKALEKYLIEGELRRQVRENIDRLKRVGSYRGLRHKMNLPARGQRTRSNARTRKGHQRKTVGSMTKEMAAKVAETKKAK